MILGCLVCRTKESIGNESNHLNSIVSQESRTLANRIHRATQQSELTERTDILHVLRSYWRLTSMKFRSMYITFFYFIIKKDFLLIN